MHRLAVFFIFCSLLAGSYADKGFFFPFVDVFPFPEINFAPAPVEEASPSPAPADQFLKFSLPKLYIKKGEITDGNGQRIVIRGTNWFGFNNGQTMVDGLWAGGTSAASDFSTVIYQLKLLGFNAIRLPFTFSDLKKDVLDKRISCKVSTLEDIYKRTRNRKPPLGPVNFKGDKCNVDMPNTGKTIDRFIWAIRQCLNHGLYVIIDYHGMGSEQTPRDPAKFIAEWKNVWNAIKRSPYFASEMDRRVMIDIFNEPDSMGLKWKEMDVLYKGVIAATGYSLYLIEGTGQNAWNMNWGDGFVTDKKIIQREGIDDANVFFNNLPSNIKDKIIISPHIYGPSITKSTKAFKGPDFFARMDASFGKFKGVYPILIGEFGINFSDNRDIETMADFARYLRARGIKDWLHWNYAENGADTNNIAVNNWQDLNWKVLNWLKRDFDLMP